MLVLLLRLVNTHTQENVMTSPYSEFTAEEKEVFDLEYQEWLDSQDDGPYEFFDDEDNY